MKGTVATGVIAKNPSASSWTGVLIARPEPGLSETMDAVRALGWTPFAAPALIIEPRFPPPQTKLSAALLTSSQAVAALSASVAPDVPVFAVGDATARRVRAAGFHHVNSAGADAGALAALVRARLAPSPAPILLLSGAGQGLELASELRQAGFKVLRRIAYSAHPVHAFPAAILRALQSNEIGIVTAFSARSAAATGAALKASGYDCRQLRGIAISDKAAHALRKSGIADVRVARHPDAASVIAALGHPPS
ncbi:uroporphyrinogen-III synthase [Acetobacter musti]|uniref:Uroporphyrinogen-III synthase n=1 Tax=Acetobacter musti TaxID=864732 RepID=A0ABX0JPB1_9PROT|nr:uroporphyrinogen-III synthase [Acetobacter musti]NHN85291.1 uroporphyrinogen-III synthase [Acetobacter musti]